MILHVRSASYKQFCNDQVKYVRAVTLNLVEGVVLRKILVMRAKVTVMVGVMVVLMMEIVDVKEILCVEAIIVCSLVSTIMKRMIVVRKQK